MRKIPINRKHTGSSFKQTDSGRGNIGRLAFVWYTFLLLTEDANELSILLQPPFVLLPIDFSFLLLSFVITKHGGTGGINGWLVGCLLDGNGWAFLLPVTSWMAFAFENDLLRGKCLIELPDKRVNFLAFIVKASCVYSCRSCGCSFSAKLPHFAKPPDNLEASFPTPRPSPLPFINTTNSRQRSSSSSTT